MRIKTVSAALLGLALAGVIGATASSAAPADHSTCSVGKITSAAAPGPLGISPIVHWLQNNGGVAPFVTGGYAAYCP